MRHAFWTKCPRCEKPIRSTERCETCLAEVGVDALVSYREGVSQGDDMREMQMTPDLDARLQRMAKDAVERQMIAAGWTPEQREQGFIHFSGIVTNYEAFAREVASAVMREQQERDAQILENVMPQFERDDFDGAYWLPKGVRLVDLDVALAALRAPTGE